MHQFKIFSVTDRELLLSEAPTLAKILLGRVNQTQRRKSIADNDVSRRKSFSIRPRSSTDLTPSSYHRRNTGILHESRENNTEYYTSDLPSDALFKPSSGNICLAYSPDA